jgi:hypothetical protein
VVEVPECSAQEFLVRHGQTQAACPHVRKLVRPRGHAQANVRVALVSVPAVPVSVQVLPAVVVHLRRWQVDQRRRLSAVAVAAGVQVAVAASLAAAGVQVGQVPLVVRSVVEVVDVQVVVPHVAANRSGRNAKSLTTWQHPPLVAPQCPWAMVSRLRFRVEPH